MLFNFQICIPILEVYSCLCAYQYNKHCLLAWIYHSCHSHLYNNFCPVWIITEKNRCFFFFYSCGKGAFKAKFWKYMLGKIFFMFVSPVTLIELCSQMRMGLWVVTEVWPPPVWDNEKQSQWNAQLLVKCAINWWFSSSTVITHLSSR